MKSEVLIILFILTLLFFSIGCDDSSTSSGQAGSVQADDDDDDDDNANDDDDDTVGYDDYGNYQPPQIVSDSFTIRESVEQLHIWNCEPDIELDVLDPSGDLVFSSFTDYQGSLVVRELEPGYGYVVRLARDHEDFTDQLTVMTVEESLPSQSFYDTQVLEIGYGYLTTRDGTELSIFVSLPGPVENGPYPTLLNMSGYSPSRPGQSVGGDAENFCWIFPVLCDAPNHPYGIIGSVLGYATVGVNIRGTGCSGGAYDYFEMLQLLDGYDAIEVIAAQEWVLNNKVAMVGLSYPGITQIFTASTNPPSLASISPFSVIADTVSSTLLPGGIYNNGFAFDWIEMVLDRAAPYGHGWITDVVEAGDAICEENQLLHSQKLDAIAKALENPFYTDEVAGPVDPTTFVHKIGVPVFMAGQVQDEQTGPHFPALFDKFTGAPVTRFTITNGVHMDGYSPQNLVEWNNFQAFYLSGKIPRIPFLVRLIMPIFMEDVFESSQGMNFPPDRFASYTNFELAKADYEAEDDVRVIFETGAHPDVEPGAPVGTFEASFPSWPIPSTVPTRFYFQPDGSLLEVLPPDDGSACEFEHDPLAGDRVNLASGSVNHLQPDWDYRQPVPGKAVSFITPPLAQDMVLVGPASIDLWLQSTADDADLEVNLTEVRPDGLESYVQSGWLRASHRGLRAESTELRPVNSHYEEDVIPLVDGQWNEARVELMPIVHIFRAGSRIRLTVDTPGDSMARWRFLLLEFDTPPTNIIAHNLSYPSSIVLPVIPGIVVLTPLPQCHALRGQPCRTYVEYVNQIAP